MELLPRQLEVQRTRVRRIDGLILTPQTMSKMTRTKVKPSIKVAKKKKLDEQYCILSIYTCRSMLKI